MGGNGEGPPESQEMRAKERRVGAGGGLKGFGVLSIKKDHEQNMSPPALKGPRRGSRRKA